MKDKSALAGFLTGAFLPIGMFPPNIRKLFALVPAHHGATLMRRVMTEEPLAAVFGSVPDQTVKRTFMTAREITDIYASENGITYLFDELRNVRSDTGPLPAFSAWKNRQPGSPAPFFPAFPPPQNC